MSSELSESEFKLFTEIGDDVSNGVAAISKSIEVKLGDATHRQETIAFRSFCLHLIEAGVKGMVQSTGKDETKELIIDMIKELKYE